MYSSRSVAFRILLCLMTVLTASYAFNRAEPMPYAEEKRLDEVMAGSREKARVLYDAIGLDSLGLSRPAFQSALEGYFKLKDSGIIFSDEHITVIDFSLPSTRKRLFLIDLKEEKLILSTYVAHGQGSGLEFAKKFSNRPASYQSSLGFFRTAETYQGKHGYSLKLEGLEEGINHLADERSIVLHGASYVSERYIRMRGMLGRSQGCPAVPESCHRILIDQIKEGQCFFIYAPDHNYLSLSRILHT